MREVSGRGLAENQGLVTFELTLVALNPFVNSIDIVCTPSRERPRCCSVLQQRLQLSGGKFFF
jgi:hypothetical protein